VTVTGRKGRPNAPARLITDDHGNRREWRSLPGMSDGLDRDDGDAIAEHALSLVARAGEHLPDGSTLAFVGSTSVWLLPDGGVQVVTMETDT
jgi:hypothetical protein